MARSRGMTIGDEAPDFTAVLSSGDEFTLSHYRGKKNVVLFFYPKDFTPGCTREVCGFSNVYDRLMEFDVVLIGVSFDSARSHQRFINAHRLPFPLISDTDKRIGTLYGTTDRFGGLVPGSKRMTFVIDKGGKVVEILKQEIFVGGHIAGALKTLEKLKS